MTKWSVGVFARVRPSSKHHSRTKTTTYQLLEDEDGVSRGIELSAPKRRPTASDYVVDNNPTSLQFRFNRVFGPQSTQSQVYQHVVHEAVASALEGYNNTVFAYGQTGSGKTYTISGGDSYADRGIIPRVIEHVFTHVDSHPEYQFSILISYFEIYNEAIYDLLDRSHRSKPIEEWNKIDLRNDDEGAVELRNLQLFDTKTERDALNLLFLGNVNRMTAETAMNHASSRSHCIFTVHIERRERGSDTVRCSKVHFVDLAGSERIFKTENRHKHSSQGSNRKLSRSHSVAASPRGSITSFHSSTNSTANAGVGSIWNLKQRDRNLTRREGASINLSLHYLEQVITALQQQQQQNRNHERIQRRLESRRNSFVSTNSTTGSDSASASGNASVLSTPYKSSMNTSSHTTFGVTPSSTTGSSVYVPYRNSLLTSVLRDSLGGNCRTVFIATLNPEDEFVHESISTCRFAQRCGMLRSHVRVNEAADPITVANKLRAYNKRLKSRVRQLCELLITVGIPETLLQQIIRGDHTDASQQDLYQLIEQKKIQIGTNTIQYRPLSLQDERKCQTLVAQYLRTSTSTDLQREQEREQERQKDTSLENGNSISETIDRPCWWVPVADMAQAQLCMALLKKAVHAAIDKATLMRNETLRYKRQIEFLQSRSDTPVTSTTDVPSESLPENPHLTKSTTQDQTSINGFTQETVELNSEERKAALNHSPVKPNPDGSENKVEVLRHQATYAIDDPASATAAVASATGRSPKTRSTTENEMNPLNVADSNGNGSNSNYPSLHSISSHPKDSSRYKELMDLVCKGAAFWLHTSDGDILARFVWVSADQTTIYWGAVNSSHVFGSIPIEQFAKVVPGRISQPTWPSNFACFSLCSDHTSKRSSHKMSLNIELELDDRATDEFQQGYDPTKYFPKESGQNSHLLQTIENARNVWMEAFTLLLNKNVHSSTN